MDRAAVAPLPSNEVLLAARTAALAYYSPYHFLRGVNSARQQELFGVGAARRHGAEAGEELLTATIGPVQWLLRHLAWDSDYFGTPTYRLLTGLFTEQASAAELQVAAADLRTQLAGRGAFYAFSVVPTEDTRLLQALTGAGWSLIETRLTYYHDSVATFDWPRYPVRLARPEEAEAIGQIAAAARNPYDRFHADPWFGSARADAFLARYAAATVAGDCGATAVLVPDTETLPVDSFLSLSDLSVDAAALGVPMGRAMLAAVGPQNRGWYLKLMAESLHRARERGQRYVLATTQATNQVVFRTWSKLGFQLGATVHVLACHLPLPA